MKLFTDALHRIAYSTDASAYREVPAAVAFPRGEDDIVALMAEARQRGVCLIPRAAGTSLAGQVVGRGIVADVSRHMNAILEINAAERWARVQPGVVLDELNLACKPYSLFFSPETSTSNRCCIGGMFGNNSCGSHSLIYGSTRHHVLEAKVVLADGSTELCRSYSVGALEDRFGRRFWERPGEGPLIRRIYSQLIGFALERDTANMIAASYPDKTLRRRSCGYAIDEVIEDLTDESKPLESRTINLCRLLCGSEGTLAFVTEIKVDLDVIVPAEKMALCIHCDALEKCYEANLVCLRHKPDAVELIDGHILELARQNGAQQANRFFVSGEPAGLLVAELSAPTAEALAQKCRALEAELAPLAYCCTHVPGKDIAKVWSLRKAGLGLLSGMKGDAKPIGVIEDTAVAPERLPAYLRDFKKMLLRLGLDCVFYGHISTGELHLRPILNIKTEEGRRQFRNVARESALLVKKHHGSLSGEHGDGRLRGEFIPLLYGQEAYALMCAVKDLWDPDGLLNVGKIVRTPRMDECLRYDLNQQYRIDKELGDTYYNWLAAFDGSGVRSQNHALMCSVEQCNGAGDCRKSSLMGGTMCPAYKASRDETQTTRARANTLREILTRGWDSPAFDAVRTRGSSIFDTPELKEVLDSCLACKGCRSECPSNVDLARLRSEVLQHIYDKKGMPRRAFLVSHMAAIERIGSMVAPAYNAVARWGLTSRLIKCLLGFAPERQIPALSRHSLRTLARQELRAAGGRKVYVFADEFTNYQEAELGITFVRLLTRLGYDVEIPRHGESGRAAISKGNLRHARKCAERNLRLLKDVVTDEAPLVGIEPSCILTFRDEYPDLVAPAKRDEALQLASRCLLYDEFLAAEMAKGHITPEQFSDEKVEVWLHGHCHQKALVGIDKTVDALRLIRNATVHVIPSGCCGMAGSFGYEKEHYKTSLEIGETILFPAVRRAAAGPTPAVVLAPGTSCRQHIHDATSATAVHPLVLLHRLLK